MRKDAFVTKRMLDQAVDTVLKGVEHLLSQTKKELRGEMKEGFRDTKKELRGEMKEGFREIKTEIRFVKDDVKGLKAELSDTPSRKDHEALKRRVGRYHPVS